METERLLEKCILVLESEVRSLQKITNRHGPRQPGGVLPLDLLLLRSKGAMLANLRRARRHGTR